MSIPDFTRAEYVEPQVIEGEVVGRPVTSAAAGAFPKAILLGCGAALAGALLYALVGLSGFMVSIVAIAVAWLIAKAMMAASHGIGGRAYQITAVVLTYFAVNLGEVLVPLWRAHGEGVSVIAMLPIGLKYLFAGPFLGLGGNGFNGALGILILLIGMRAAWRMTAGGPVGNFSVFGRR